MGAIPLHREEIEYPTSDGQPMAETTLHRKVMTDLIEGLERRFQEAPNVWVGGNLFVYFERGNPRAVVAPDVVLVKGVPKWDRPIYKLWEEGEPPTFVVEVTSDKTRTRISTTRKANTCGWGSRSTSCSIPMATTWTPASRDTGSNADATFPWRRNRMERC
jgi:Uma2 family endonuclease